MAGFQHGPQRQLVVLLDIAGARQGKNEVAREELPHELARAQKFDLHLLFGVLPQPVPERRSPFDLALDLAADLLLHDPVQGQTLHHPTERMKPRQVADLMKNDVPLARHEEHVERAVDLIAARAAGVCGTQTEGYEWKLRIDSQADHGRVDVPLDCCNEPTIAATAR